MPLRHARPQGKALILLAAVLWSLGGVFIKSLSLHPAAIVLYRSLFASLFFLPFLRRGPWPSGPPLLVSLASYTASLCSFVWANKLTSAANAIVLQYTAPLFVFIFVRFFFGEAIPRRNRLALAAGMAGIGVIFAGSRGTPDAAGVGVALLSGFFFGVFVTNLRLLKAADPITLTFANNLACALILLPLVRGELGVRPGELVALALMGVVQLGIPYWLFTRGVQTVAVQEASLMVLIEPVLNPVWVAWGVGEWPAATTLVGGGIILSSLALRYWWLGESPPAPGAQAKGRPSEGRAESPRSD